jgi:NSS family neurotransmitter:Na+ symporter
LVEAGAASLIDKFKLKRIHVNIGFAVIAGIIGLIYTTRGGLFWLDIVDYFMNNFGLLAIGVLMCVAVGWCYKHKEIREYANSKSDFTIGKWWDFCVRYLTPVVVGALFITNVVDRVKSAYGGYARIAEFLGGWLVIAVFVLVAVLLFKKKGRT